MLSLQPFKYPLVLDSILRFEAASRIPSQATFQKAHEALVIARQDGSELLSGRATLLPSRIGYNTRLALRIKKHFLAIRDGHQLVGGSAENLHDACELLHLVFTRKQRISCVQLSQYAPKAPHVNRSVVRQAEYYFWGTIESRLNVSVNTLVFKTRGSKVNDFNS